jgi:hypothetical protein
MTNDSNFAPEARLELGLVAGAFIIPVSLLMFGWTARESVHGYVVSAFSSSRLLSFPIARIVTIIGAALYFPRIFLVFQCILLYYVVHQRHQRRLSQVRRLDPGRQRPLPLELRFCLPVRPSHPFSSIRADHLHRGARSDPSATLSLASSDSTGGLRSSLASAFSHPSPPRINALALLFVNGRVLTTTPLFAASQEVRRSPSRGLHVGRMIVSYNWTS